jgi:hypothetical protein
VLALCKSQLKAAVATREKEKEKEKEKGLPLTCVHEEVEAVLPLIEVG